LARRAQSDRASREIANLLLQGWSLLADECPSCHTPLVRRPRPRPPTTDDAPSTSSRKAFSSTRTLPSTPAVDPRKVCVVCRREYVNESDVGSLNSIVSSTLPQESNQRKKRSRETDSFESVSRSKVKGRAPTSRVVNLDRGVGMASVAVNEHDVLPTSATGALNTALEVLTNNLSTLSQSSPPNVTAIGDCADAITKVARTLTEIRLLSVA